MINCVCYTPGCLVFVVVGWHVAQRQFIVHSVVFGRLHSTALFHSVPMAHCTLRLFTLGCWQAAQWVFVHFAPLAPAHHVPLLDPHSGVHFDTIQHLVAPHNVVVDHLLLFGKISIHPCSVEDDEPPPSPSRIEEFCL